MAVTNYKTYENEKQGGGKGEVTTTKTEGSFLNTEKEEKKKKKNRKQNKTRRHRRGYFVHIGEV